MVDPAHSALPPPMLLDQRLGPLVERHAVQARLCAQLEAMADHLPQRPDEHNRRALASALKCYQEELCVAMDDLRASLQGASPARPLAGILLAHISSRRIATVETADNLIVAFEQKHGDGHCLCAETLGFMLRSFFDSCRDALALEKVAILLIAGDHLTPGARALLEQRLATPP